MSGAPMRDEGFLRRWSRLKSSGPEPAAPAPAAPLAPAPPPAPDARAEARPEQPLPTLEDVAALSFESDYSGFVAQGVDKAVQRLALKKLFADPHFKLMDGLDIYIDDYNKASPLGADMLAQLRHADSALARVLEDEPPEPGAVAEGDMQADAPAEQQGNLQAQAQGHPQGNA